MSPLVPPPLGNDRVRLVAPSADQVADYFEYGRDPRFYVHLGARPFREMSEARRFIEALEADVAAGRRCYWAITHPDDGRVVGTLGFNFLFPPEQKMADFGYGLSPECWGTGMFGAAARLVLGFGFDQLDLDRVQVMTPAENVASVKAVERLGFRREGTLREFYPRTAGIRRDCAVLGLLRRDWK